LNKMVIGKIVVILVSIQLVSLTSREDPVLLAEVVLHEFIHWIQVSIQLVSLTSRESIKDSPLLVLTHHLVSFHSISFPNE
jgi:hypothetical protein